MSTPFASPPAGARGSGICSATPSATPRGAWASSSEASRGGRGGAAGSDGALAVFAPQVGAPLILTAPSPAAVWRRLALTYTLLVSAMGLCAGCSDWHALSARAIAASQQAEGGDAAAAGGGARELSAASASSTGGGLAAADEEAAKARASEEGGRTVPK